MGLKNWSPAPPTLNAGDKFRSIQRMQTGSHNSGRGLKITMSPAEAKMWHELKDSILEESERKHIKIMQERMDGQHREYMGILDEASDTVHRLSNANAKLKCKLLKLRKLFGYFMRRVHDFNKNYS